jgi:hypothetical protein
MPGYKINFVILMILALIFLTTLIYSAEIICSGICCDFNFSDSADEEDFLMLLVSTGKIDYELEDCYCGGVIIDGVYDWYDYLLYS